MPVKLFAGLDQRERLGGIDAQRLEHRRRHDFAYAALQRQPAIARARPRRLAGPFGAKIEQPSLPVAKLREQESAPVSDLWVVNLELVAVIRLRQRLFERTRKRN